MTSTKTCPKCAETIQAAATVCRYCGHKFGGGLAVWIAGACVVILLASFCSTDPAPESTAGLVQNAPDPVPALSADQLSACRKSVDNLVASRAIIERRGGLVRVRAADWGELTGIEQTTIVAGIACAEYGRAIQGLSGLDQVVIVKDSATGDTLASAAEGMMMRK